MRKILLSLRAALARRRPSNFELRYPSIGWAAFFSRTRLFGPIESQERTKSCTECGVLFRTSTARHVCIRCRPETPARRKLRAVG